MTLRPGEKSPVKPLRKSLSVDGSLRECLIKQRRDSRRNGKSIAITVATGCGKSFLGMVIGSEAIERGFNVK